MSITAIQECKQAVKLQRQSSFLNESSLSFDPEAPMHENREFRLGKRELEILNVVWELGEATVQDVCDRLARPHHSTVQTMMRTLETKQLLDHRVFGRTFVYRPLVSRAHVRGSKLRELCDTLFGGSVSLVFTSMLDRASMSRVELDELRRLLNKVEVKDDDA